MKRPCYLKPKGIRRTPGTDGVEGKMGKSPLVFRGEKAAIRKGNVYPNLHSENSDIIFVQPQYNHPSI